MGDFGKQFLIDLQLGAISSDPWMRRVDANQWTATVDGLLQKIAGSTVGIALLNGLKGTGQWTLIVPPDPRAGGCRASTNAIPKGSNGHFGVGVEFDPNTFAHGSYCDLVRHQSGAPGMLPNEVLFHELFHAFRYLSGAHNTNAVSGGLGRYHSEEEFYAVVVTNIYISDPSNKRKSSLRADWEGHRPLEDYLNRSLRFFQSSPEVYPLLKKLTKDKGLDAFCAAIKKVDACFNPIAALLNGQEALAMKLSDSRTAHIRDERVTSAPPKYDYASVDAALAKRWIEAAEKAALKALRK